jgi:hypothetical protein
VVSLVTFDCRIFIFHVHTPLHFIYSYCHCIVAGHSDHMSKRLDVQALL